MYTFGVMAFTFAMMALGVAALVYIRLDNLEKRLKERDSVFKEAPSQD